MFAFSSRSSPALNVEGQRLQLRYPLMADYEQWAQLRRRNADYLRPWEPKWTGDDLTRPAFRGRLRQYESEIKIGTAHPFFIFRKPDRQLLGGITLGNIRYGASQSGTIGYWLGQEYSGLGYMSEALRLVCNQGFETNNLHRIEAACIPDNHRSKNILERAGFSCEGTVRSYLKINGEWRDHLLFALINPRHLGAPADARPGGATVA